MELVALFKKPDGTLSYAESNSNIHVFPEMDMCAIKFTDLPLGTEVADISDSVALQGQNSVGGCQLSKLAVSLGVDMKWSIRINIFHFNFLKV